MRGAVRQTHPERLDRGGHGVRRVHAAAGTGAGDGARLEAIQILVADFIIGMHPNSFEHGHYVNGPAIKVSGENCSAINEDPGPIQARQSHHAARHILVAATDGDQAVKAFAAGNRFDGVGDDFAGHERILHAFCAHGDAIRNRDCAKYDCLAAGFVHALRDVDGELVDVHVAGRDHAPGGGDADLRFLEIFLRVACRVQHGPAGGALVTIQDNGRKLPFVGCAFAGFLAHISAESVVENARASKPWEESATTADYMNQRGAQRRTTRQNAKRGFHIFLVITGHNWS